MEIINWQATIRNDKTDVRFINCCLHIWYWMTFEKYDQVTGTVTCWYGRQITKPRRLTWSGPGWKFLIDGKPKWYRSYRSVSLFWFLCLCHVCLWLFTVGTCPSISGSVWHADLDILPSSPGDWIIYNIKNSSKVFPQNDTDLISVKPTLFPFPAVRYLYLGLGFMQPGPS